MLLEGLPCFPTKCTDFNPLNWSLIGPLWDRIPPDFKDFGFLVFGLMLTFSTKGKALGIEFEDEDDTWWCIPSCLCIVSALWLDERLKWNDPDYKHINHNWRSHHQCFNLSPSIYIKYIPCMTCIVSFPIFMAMITLTHAVQRSNSCPVIHCPSKQFITGSFKNS